MNEIENNIDLWVNIYLGPDFKFRDHQKEAIINIIDKVVNNDRTTQIIEAPTGSGKSLIAMISAGVLDKFYKKRSYILCSDLFLFEQYEKFINEKQIDFGCIKGQLGGNYLCDQNQQDIRNGECRMARISWPKLFFKPEKVGYTCAKTCKYVQLRKKAVMANVTVMTYQLFLFQTMKQELCPPEEAASKTKAAYCFDCRDVIFCDECHNIPDIIHTKYEPTFSPKLIDKIKNLYQVFYNKQNNELFEHHDYNIIKEYPTWKDLNTKLKGIYNILKDYRNSDNDVNDKLNEFYNIMDAFSGDVEDLMCEIECIKLESNKPIDTQKLEEFKICTWWDRANCEWNEYDEVLTLAGGSQYMVREISLDKKENHYIIKFSCAKEDFMISKYILSKAYHHILLSATVGDKNAYDENIGMKYMGYESTMERIPSTFDYSKSPVYYMTQYKMSYKEKDKNFPIIQKIAYNIIEKFKDYHGLIQTGSYDNAQKIYDNAPFNVKQRLLLYHDSSEKDSMIQYYNMTSNTILIGPTLNEGIDLPDDGCRFIIICKVPYPSLASNIVKKKIELFPLWYNATTSNDIIQGIGRGVRNNNDWCITYILDGCFPYLYYQTRTQYSPELQARMQKI